MAIISSHLNTQSAEYKANHANMEKLLHKLQQLIATIAEGGDEKARARHLAHGKLLPRERLQQLLIQAAHF